MLLRISLALVVVLATARSASADDGLNLYAGIVGGYSATVDQPEGVADPMGLAIGARAGLTLPTTSVYVGGLFLYHVGDSVSLGTGGAELSSSSYMLGAEGGYEWSLGPLVLRPSLGLGLFSRSESVEGPIVGVNWEGSDDNEAFYLSPGLNALITLGLLLGAEVRYNAVLGDPRDSISLLATIGVEI
jgi:Outer membrane protein beta-barrel domain